jgi:hypothetical protein
MLEQALGPKFILYPGLAGAIVLVRGVLWGSQNARYLRSHLEPRLSLSIRLSCLPALALSHQILVSMATNALKDAVKGNKVKTN